MFVLIGATAISLIGQDSMWKQGNKMSTRNSDNILQNLVQDLDKSI